MVENAFGISVSRFRVVLGTMKQRPRVVRDMCEVAHMPRTHHGRAPRAPNPGNDVGAQQNEQAEYVSIRTTGILRGRPNINEYY